MQCFKIKAEMQDVYSSALFKDIRIFTKYCPCVPDQIVCCLIFFRRARENQSPKS